MLSTLRWLALCGPYLQKAKAIRLLWTAPRLTGIPTSITPALGAYRGLDDQRSPPCQGRTHFSTWRVAPIRPLSISFRVLKTSAGNRPFDQQSSAVAQRQHFPVVNLEFTLSCR